MTSLGDKIKVERLDTGRLARIEEKVVAAHALPDLDAHERPTWLRFAPLAAAACALVLVAGALGYWLRGGGGLAGTAPTPAITTGPGEQATVAVGDAIVTIEQNTLVTFRTRPDGRIDLDLARGKVYCDVTPRPGRPVFAVHAFDVDVAVLGTAFSVDASGSEILVKVVRGKVLVTRGGKATMVAAGQGWPAGTVVAAADPDPGSDRDPDPGPNPDPGPDPDPDPGSDPDPDPGVQTQHEKTGHREQDTGHRTQDIENGGKTAVKVPAGLPTLADCSDRCLATANDTANDDATQSRALYTAVHNALSTGSPGKAITYGNLYLRRFPKGAEAAAVRQLRRIAEGGE